MTRSSSEALEQHTAQVMSGWPPLTPEQADKLAVLLKSGGDDK